MEGQPRRQGDDPLAPAIATRISHTLHARGADIDDTLEAAILAEATRLASAVTDGTDGTDADMLADACASMLCDLPPASVMGILLPDPHLASLEHDLRAICEVGRGCDLRDIPPCGEGDGTLAQRVWRYADDATVRWGMMSPHGKALARVDKVAVRKGLMVGLGFDGYLRAEREMAGIFDPRKPYSLGAYGKGHEEDGE